MLQLNFNPFPILATDRLELRQLRPEDAEALYVMRTDEATTQYLNHPKPANIEDVQAFIEKINNAIRNNESIFWVLAGEDDKPAGTICLWNIDKEQEKAEAGFVLHPGYEGNGLMQEALEAVIAYGFEMMQLKTIEGWTHKDNIRSQKLLEKFGFSRDTEAEAKHAGSEELKTLIAYTLAGKQ